MIPTLIAKLEQAEGGSRELDCMIAVHPDTPNGNCNRHASLEALLAPCPFGITGIDEQAPRDSAIFHYTPETTADYIGVPNYTTSLDAALTLIPEGRSCSILVDTTDASATVFDPEEGDGEIQHAHASTPALALCIAALKARLAEQENKG